jgi:DNA-binding NarL/FixJ family response regulator
MPKVLIADDHPLFRDAIKDVVGQVFAARGWEFACQEATRSEEVTAAAERDEELDLILLDLSMPGASGMSTLVALRSKAPATPIIVVSSLDDPGTIRQAIALGAAGFIPKSSSKDLIATALETVFAGGVYLPRCLLDDLGEDERARAAPGEERAANALTSRQLAVLDLLARGLSNKLIARDLDISDMTVKAHVTAILRKLGVSSRAQAIVMFRQQQAP